MIDANDPAMILVLDRRAKSLSGLADQGAVERALADMHKTAEAAFLALGQSDLEAWLAADALIGRHRSLVASYRRTGAAREHDREARERGRVGSTLKPLRDLRSLPGPSRGGIECQTDRGP